VSYTTVLGNIVESSSSISYSRKKREKVFTPKNFSTVTDTNIILYSMLCFKGTVQRDFNLVFLHILIGLGLNMNRFYLKNVSEAPLILDQRTFSSCGSGEILSEKLYFSENFYK
jgi:hypothetical protein